MNTRHRLNTLERVPRPQDASSIANLTVILWVAGCGITQRLYITNIYKHNILFQSWDIIWSLSFPRYCIIRRTSTWACSRVKGKTAAREHGPGLPKAAPSSLVVYLFDFRVPSLRSAVHLWAYSPSATVISIVTLAPDFYSHDNRYVMRPSHILHHYYRHQRSRQLINIRRGGGSLGHCLCLELTTSPDSSKISPTSAIFPAITSIFSSTLTPISSISIQMLFRSPAVESSSSTISLSFTSAVSSSRMAIIVQSSHRVTISATMTRSTAIISS